MLMHSSHATPGHTPPWGRFISPEHPLWHWYIGERLPQGWWTHRSLWPVSVALPLHQEQGALFGQDDRDLDATFLRLAFNAARHDWKVFWFDPYGSPEHAARFVTAMCQAHCARTAVFPLTPHHRLQRRARSYDHADAAYFSFPTFSHPEQARLLARALLADFSSYLIERKRDAQPVLVLIKHPMALFESSQLFSLYALVAAHKSSLFVAEHTPADFGRDTYRLLHSVQTLILHRSSTAEPFEPLLAVSGRRQRIFSRTLRTLPPLHSFILDAGELLATRIAPVQLDTTMLRHARLTLSSRWTCLEKDGRRLEYGPPLHAGPKAPDLRAPTQASQRPASQPASSSERCRETVKRCYRQRGRPKEKRRRAPISTTHHKPGSSKGRARHKR